MANPTPLELTTDGAALIELDEEIDGDEVGSRNYRFCKVGEPVPIKSDDNSEFEPQCLPSQPLAVSERFRLLFIAHPQGFCVARTKDVMASAEEIKEKQTGPSVQELSLVDVSIGKVSILALSADDSLLAVTIDNHVHFFAVSALLHKDQKPSYSVSLDDSICIKDMRWARKVAKAYIILSDDGKLYYGSGQGPPSYLMEGVDSARRMFLFHQYTTFFQ
ncbi:UNVERIFIED_CONTAM: Nuclear pore complex protein [Sesamum angustifolium]|uniref:Nuclear pore complex protein n=1 Tax=Sesamum angustifolium TaxID=2727405 RepID=A0AAW2QR04_9LAMI